MYFIVRWCDGRRSEKSPVLATSAQRRSGVPAGWASRAPPRKLIGRTRSIALLGEIAASQSPFSCDAPTCHQQRPAGIRCTIPNRHTFLDLTLLQVAGGCCGDHAAVRRCAATLARHAGTIVARRMVTEGCGGRTRIAALLVRWTVSGTDWGVA